MSLDNSYRAYGRYLVTLNRLNPLLDAAIVRETGLGPAAGAIVAGALNIKSRLGVLRALMQNSGGEKLDVVPLLAEIAQEIKKQPIVQGLASAGGTNSLVFTRSDVGGGRMGGATAEYTGEEMDELADALEARIEALARALDIAAADLSALKRAGDEMASRRRRGGHAGEANGDDE
jgi:hypothetical protein